MRPIRHNNENIIIMDTDLINTFINFGISTLNPPTQKTTTYGHTIYIRNLDTKPDPNMIQIVFCQNQECGLTAYIYLPHILHTKTH